MSQNDDSKSRARPSAVNGNGSKKSTSNVVLGVVSSHGENETVYRDRRSKS